MQPAVILMLCVNACIEYISVEYIVLFTLKGLAQAKIIKKSVILFRVLNMTI